MKNKFRKIVFYFAAKLIPELRILRTQQKGIANNVKKHNLTRIATPYDMTNVTIEQGTYISSNAKISETSIGKYCSIGPNLLCGFGIHPTNGLSTSPIFYSTKNQCGYSFSKEDKIEERKSIKIGNDVFIGMNVIILDGVMIGDGAIIGAGAVVSKDIPAYAIATGIPIQIKKYRFDDETISRLLKIKWWDFDEQSIKDVEEYFFRIDSFIEKYKSTL